MKNIIAAIRRLFGLPSVKTALASIEGTISYLEHVALTHAAEIERKAEIAAKLAIENAAHEAEHLYAVAIGNNLKALLTPPAAVAKVAKTPAATTAAINSAEGPQAK